MKVYKAIKDDLSMLIILMIFIYFFIGIFNISVDSTDKDGFNRSGVNLITDYGTGLQYLYRNGALIPRVDANGRHININK